MLDAMITGVLFWGALFTLAFAVEHLTGGGRWIL